MIAGSDAGNMGFSLPYAFHLLNAGYHVILFDYRGFGSSTDFDYNPNNVYHEEYITDFVIVVNWAKKETSQNKICVLSYSMGTLIASVGFSESKFDLYIGEGFITLPKNIKKRVAEIKKKELFLPKNDSQHSQKIDQLNIPTLLFASKLDKITTAQDARDFCAQKKIAKIIEYDGEHLRGAATLGFEKYINVINEFIGKH